MTLLSEQCLDLTTNYFVLKKSRTGYIISAWSGFSSYVTVAGQSDKIGFEINSVIFHTILYLDETRGAR